METKNPVADALVGLCVLAKRGSLPHDQLVEKFLREYPEIAGAMMAKAFIQEIQLVIKVMFDYMSGNATKEHFAGAVNKLEARMEAFR